MGKPMAAAKGPMEDTPFPARHRNPSRQVGGAEVFIGA